MNKLKSLLKKDISPLIFWLLVGCVVIAKLALAHFQQIYVWVGGAPIDDELMFEAAVSISNGQWLGEYNYLTLSKQMFFAVWLALCNKIGLPYLMAGQLLLCAAALAAAKAFAPVLQKRWQQWLLFAALAANPAAAASFTLRVYRDNIFPSQCLLFFAGLIGYALRYKKGLGRNLFWLVLAGLGLGSAYITREDGIWLLPFGLAAVVIVAVYILREKELKHKLARCAAMTVPYLLTAVFVLGMSAMNYKHYGVFTTTDFSSGSFAAAYGAMTRIEHENERNLVPVPKDVRDQLYVAVPQLQPLEKWLEENPHIQNAYMNKAIGDYMGGSFYWVLRRAAQEEGLYTSAPEAAAYWQSVADGINAAIDSGVLTAAAGPRSSTTPIIKGYHVLPTLQETFFSLYYCATFQDCLCYYDQSISLVTPDDALFWADYLGSMPNYAAREGSAEPYYSGMQLLVYKVFDCLRMAYAVIIPVFLVWSVLRQIRTAVTLHRQKDTEGLLLWLILLGVLAMALLRCAMIAFMEVAAFDIGTYVMYLSTVHPLLILYAVVGTLHEANKLQNA